MGPAYFPLKSKDENKILSEIKSEYGFWGNSKVPHQIYKFLTLPQKIKAIFYYFN